MQKFLSINPSVDRNKNKKIENNPKVINDNKMFSFYLNQQKIQKQNQNIIKKKDLNINNNIDISNSLNNKNKIGTEFKKIFSNYLKDLKVKFKEDIIIKGLSGDFKKFDFCVKNGINKYINLLSVDNYNEANKLIKINIADIIDLRQFMNSFCIVFYDQANPIIWNKIKNSSLFIFLKRYRINCFGFYQDSTSLTKYLLKNHFFVFK